jgi:hypothetical protein
MSPLSYLLGNTKAGGWCYFFLVAVAVKTPLPFLILCAVWGAVLIALKHEKR